MSTIDIRREYNDGDILLESDLDAIVDDIETFFNVTKINDDNIQTSGITASSKLVDASISTAKIANDAITTAKILDDAVTAAKIADGAIDAAAKLASDVVTTAKILDANVTLAKLATALQSSFVPAGAVLAFGGTAAPTGFLSCDGSAVSRTTYATLFTAIGTAHGTGDGATTFNLPDYRGRFLRGVDSAQARDPDAASRTAMNTGGNTGDNVGSIQAAAYASHTHAIRGAQNDGAGGSITNSIVNTNADVSNTTTVNLTAASGGNETRPINAYVNYIIKY